MRDRKVRVGFKIEHTYEDMPGFTQYHTVRVAVGESVELKLRKELDLLPHEYVHIITQQDIE